MRVSRSNESLYLVFRSTYLFGKKHLLQETYSNLHWYNHAWSIWSFKVWRCPEVAVLGSGSLKCLSNTIVLPQLYNQSYSLRQLGRKRRRKRRVGVLIVNKICSREVWRFSSALYCLKVGGRYGFSQTTVREGSSEHLVNFKTSPHSPVISIHIF